MRSASTENEFIYRQMIERQRRWYKHDKGNMLRDEQGRFVPTALCPFPEWSPQDKLLERAWLERIPINVPRARLIGTFQHPSELLELVHMLPSAGFVIKPAGELWLLRTSGLTRILPHTSSHTPLACPRVLLLRAGAGWSRGVFIVCNGHFKLYDGKGVSTPTPFDASLLVRDLCSMEGEGVWHGTTFMGESSSGMAFNLTTWLIEELVVCALGKVGEPVHFRVTLIGTTIL